MITTKEELYGYTGSSIFCLLIFLFLYLSVMRTTIKGKEEGILISFGNIDLHEGTFTLGESSQAETAGSMESVQPSESKPETVQQSVPTPKPAKQPVAKQQTTKQPVAKQQTAQQSVSKPKTTQQPVAKPKTAPAPAVQKNTTPPITQNKENTAAIEADRIKQEEKKRLEAEQLAQQAQQAKEKEEQQKRDAINKQISGAFNSGTTNKNQQETTASGGNAGNAGNVGKNNQGGSQSGSSSGKSSSGSGYGEFNLGGRTLGAGGLARPAYSVPEEGRIVINITVNPLGNVIFAEIGRGTNIDNANLRNSALDAARKTKFNSINGNNNQSGTITYRYSLT